MDWDLVTDLGQLPDKVIAEREGVRNTTVAAARMMRDIPSFRKPLKKRIRLYIPFGSNTKGVNLNIDWDLEPLGQVSDQALAALKKVAISTVREARTRRGIPSYAKSRKIEWTSDMLAALGTDSDKNLATRWACIQSTVRNQRRKLDIPAFRPTSMSQARQRKREASAKHKNNKREELLDTSIAQWDMVQKKGTK